MSVQTLGLAAFRDTIDRCLDLAELAERLVCEDDRLELMMPATLGIVCLRRRFPGADESELAARNAALVASLAASGRGMVSSTRLHGHYAIRICVLNHGSGERDIRAVLEHLATSDAGAVPPARQLDAERVPARGPQVRRVNGSAVDHHPAVIALSDAARARVHAEGREVRVPAGEVVVQRWAADRDFYLVLDGDLAVDVDGAPAPALTSGDFFGELAARDWGSGFGYPRLATVTAGSAVTLWRLPPELFVALRAGEAEFATLVDAAARDRLSRS
jgi:CRP-like cAMP-binding protein